HQPQGDFVALNVRRVPERAFVGRLRAAKRLRDGQLSAGQRFGQHFRANDCVSRLVPGHYVFPPFTLTSMRCTVSVTFAAANPRTVMSLCSIFPLIAAVRRMAVAAVLAAA